ncbi:MAG: alpha-galactosidase [Acidimicrobiales bacterium]|nr:alpha-galactosidase [Acidimicrobiales bacterium]
MHRISYGGTSVDITAGAGMPEVLGWGRYSAARAAAEQNQESYRAGLPPATLDNHPPIGLFAEESLGFPGTPGISGHRPDGTGWSPRFVRTEERVDDASASFVLEDQIAGLQLVATVAVGSGAVVTIDAVLTNIGSTPYVVHSLAPSLPVPAHAAEVLTLSGRWCMEFQMNRRPFIGSTVVENRRGRTSHENSPVVFVGTSGFAESDGHVWGAQLAWSGNYRVVAERLGDGRCYLQLGELLLPGELELAPGEAYDMPRVVATCSDNGLTAASGRFLSHVRQSVRPAELGPRPVNVNTWEAVYFDHELDRLLELADAAADVGAERFVLDDGWFGGRRDDTKGLGDWHVSPDAWPTGLSPLIDRVRRHGMVFGIWFEPEMVNPNSDLYRFHPDWTLTTDGYDPVLGRHQLVLDFGRPEVRENMFDQISRILTDHDIGYVKWDMNRSIVQGSGASGRAGVHRHVVGLYELLDDLREAHPDVEWESCSSGGARIDAGILARTDRVWTSDSNDAADRQLIQRGASLLVPPEMMGAHIGPPASHTTGRVHSLGFRAATALFGHMGIEWNLLSMAPEDRTALKEVIALYKEHRHLLHTGVPVRLDHPEESLVAHGVVDAELTEGLFSVASIATRSSSALTPLVIPWLSNKKIYRVEPLFIGGEKPGVDFAPPGWMDGGAEMTGGFLGGHGLSLPVFWPERALLVRVTEVSS